MKKGTKNVVSENAFAKDDILTFPGLDFTTGIRAMRVQSAQRLNRTREQFKKRDSNPTKQAESNESTSLSPVLAPSPERLGADPSSDPSSPMNDPKKPTQSQADGGNLYVPIAGRRRQSLCA